MQDSFTLKIKTAMSADDLAKTLIKYEPWGHQIDFDNGVSTSDFKKEFLLVKTLYKKLKLLRKKFLLNNLEVEKY